MVVFFSIIALCVGLIIGTLVGYYIATTSTSARLVAISSMKEELPTLDRDIRIGWENTATNLAHIEAHMLEDGNIFDILQFDETEFKHNFVKFGEHCPRTNCEYVFNMVRSFTKVELALVAVDLARKVENLVVSTRISHAN